MGSQGFKVLRQTAKSDHHAWMCRLSGRMQFCMKSSALAYTFVKLLQFKELRRVTIIIALLFMPPRSYLYEGPAKSFVNGFGLLQCYVLSNIFLLQTFKVFPLY